jgi:hypothetical protein
MAIVNALIAIVWIAIFTFGTAYSFSRFGVVVARPESWAAAVANGIWGYCLYRVTRSLIGRLDQLAFSRRVLIYLVLIALILASVAMFMGLVRFLTAEG